MPRTMRCAAHTHRDLTPTEIHHVFPKQYHGPDTAPNKVPLCANAHSDVHYLLEALLKGKHPDLREYGIGVRVIAARGYAAVMAYGESLTHTT